MKTHSSLQFLYPNASYKFLIMCTGVNANKIDYTPSNLSVPEITPEKVNLPESKTLMSDSSILSDFGNLSLSTPVKDTGNEDLSCIQTKG